MNYVVSVGGDPINPNPYYYSQIELMASETLIWPSINQSSDFVGTNWVDITADNTGYVVTVPPANEAGTGAEIVFNNYGSNTITINNSTGGNITTVASGLTKRIWITDNSTAAGTWRIANIGSGTTSADASMLAGYGLIAQAGQLSQSMQVAAFGTSATLNAGYRSYLAKWTGGSGVFTLSSPVSLGNNWFVNIKNAGSGTLTLAAGSATIDNNGTSISVGVNEGFTVTTDGSTFSTIGRLTPDTSGYTYLSKSVTGNTDITLSASESVYNIINFTGTLGASINVITPTAVNEWIMSNSSSGSTYTLTVKTSGGSGETLNQGDTRILYCDGTDILFADDLGGGGGGTVTSVATGTGLSGGPITSSGTIALSNTAVTAGTYGSASRAVIYTVNAQGQFTNSTDAPISITDTNISAAIGVAKGGTNSTTLTANAVILGNGTSSPQFVSPSTSGNVLTSNGTTWVSSPPGGASVVKTVKQQTFTNSGTYTPSTGMLYCVIEMVGGGGGAGGCSSAGNSGGGGGGAGSYSKSVITAATIGGSKTVTIGTGGSGGSTSGGDGSSGSTTSVGTVVTAPGGDGGSGTTGNSVKAGGAGGSAGTAQVAGTGAPGGGSFPGNTNLAVSGFGGSSPFGGGGVGLIGTANSAGNAGSGYGSGGSGAISSSGGSGHLGGDGAPGIVYITEFCSQ